MCKRPLLKVSSLSFPVFCLCLANTSPRSIEQKAIKTHHSHTWMLLWATFRPLRATFVIFKIYTWKAAESSYKGNLIMFHISLWFGIVLCSWLSWAACVLQITGGTFLLVCPISWVRACLASASEKAPLLLFLASPIQSSFIFSCPTPLSVNLGVSGHKNFFTTSVYPDTLISYHHQSQDRD